MADLEKFYYDKWMNQVAENKKLKLEIEEYKKKYEYNKNFHLEHFRYKECFIPLANAYKELLSYLNKTRPIIDKILKMYEKRLLLNPNFSKVKLDETDKNNLIRETKLQLQKYIKATEPKKVSPDSLEAKFENNHKSKAKKHYTRTYKNF